MTTAISYAISEDLRARSEIVKRHIDTETATTPTAWPPASTSPPTTSPRSGTRTGERPRGGA